MCVCVCVCGMCYKPLNVSIIALIISSCMHSLANNCLKSIVVSVIVILWYHTRMFFLTLHRYWVGTNHFAATDLNAHISAFVLILFLSVF
jgi:predicted ABC-type sugar transport system permease subunit